MLTRMTQAGAVPQEASFTLDDAFLEPYRLLTPPFGFDGVGELTYLRTYSRIKDNGEQEVWWETVRRVVEGTYSMQKAWIVAHHLGWSESKAQRSAQEMYDRMFHMKFLPPGRGLWAMGSSLTREKGLFAALNNCGFVSTQDLATDLAKPFCFLMDASMLGIGVGFDTKGANTLRLQAPRNLYDAEAVYIIPDTREGWVESVRLLLESYFVPDQVRPIFDYTEIRPEGAPIKGFGGVASGPGPLKELHKKLCGVLDPAVGTLISITHITDIMNLIGACVVAGNVRRTAEIAFGSPYSEEFLDLKNYTVNPHRAAYGWTSNNSIYAEIGMDYTQAAERVRLNGEPGFAWLENMQAYSRMSDERDFKDHRVAGANPCLTSDAWVLTNHGPRQIADLIGTGFTAIVDGRPYETLSDGFWQTGVKPVYELRTTEGYSVRLTANHQVKRVTLTRKARRTEWVEAKDLRPGDLVSMGDHRGLTWGGEGSFAEGWLLGNLLGDGHLLPAKGSARLQYWGEQKAAMLSHARNALRDVVHGRSDMGTALLDGAVAAERDTVSVGSVGLYDLAESWGLLDKALSPRVEQASSAFSSGFLRGWFDADGSVQGTQQKGVSVRLSSVSRENLEAAQRMLARMGMMSTVYHRRGAQDTLLPDGKGGERLYPCQAAYELVLANHNVGKFAERIGFTDPDKAAALSDKLASYRRTPNRERFVATVASFTYCGEEPVYDVTVAQVHEFDANGLQVHNCVEQSLESYELCCLVETFPANHADMDDFDRTLKFAYLYAKTVTLGNTHWPETNRVLLRNRRIGLSQSGIQQAIAKLGIDEYRLWCEVGYSTVRYYDDVYSEWLAIPKSVKVTSVKPSGSVSLLAGATPGMHWPEALTYIRRMRLGIHSDLVAPLAAAGYHIEPAVGSENSTLVVELPVKITDNIRTVAQVSMWEQLAMAAFLQRYWADNQVSATITFDPATEGHQIAHALTYFQYQLKGVSFLPRTEAGAYAQMPYEAITEEQYQALVTNRAPLRFGTTHEEAEQERFCSNESCTI